jgi:predicted glycosyltransferase
MKSVLTSEEIIAQSEGLHLYKNLVLQLNKDFKRANIDVDFIKDISPSGLKLKLNNAIHNLILNTNSDYLNLLYIIDVSEEKIKNIEANSTYEISEKITYFILLREWQKVWFKSNY